MYLFIVLYAYKVDDRRIQGKYHWALLACPMADLDVRALSSAKVYQITNKESIRHWRTDHKSVDVLKSERVIGFIRLPEVQGGSAVTGFIEESPAVHEEDSYPPDARQWSCAWWVIRLIRSFVDAEMMVDPVRGRDTEGNWFERFKQRVQAQGMKLEQKRGQWMTSQDTGSMTIQSIILDFNAT
ncbi:hypothetical protein BD626DRAFT_121443 [Schizophyllum amplum]|uniref:Uncharacterized protein n=1 Tax=Schizophyllum amplum TaxID=97359 RepID=A0A550C7H7_9AGAR|nr:hypothetical protein BD626DRAFT_121443 [Auriculariopsis ampla]